MNAILITVFTIIIVLVLDRLENKYIKSLLDWFPAVLFAYVIPAVICHFMGLDLAADPIHGFSKNYLIPLAIVTVMSTLSIEQLKSIGWKPIALFVSGSFWIATFPALLIFLMGQSPFVTDILGIQTYWKGIPPIVGSWIGGSTSQLVLKELVECPENIFLNILILDNLLVNIWTIIMFQFIKKSKWIDKKLSLSPVSTKSIDLYDHQRKLPIVIALLVLILIVVGVNFFTSNLVTKIIVLSVIGLAISNIVKEWPFQNVLKIGSILIIAIMAILGLKLKFDLIQINGGFLIFLIGWLISHFIFMLLIAKRLNISSAWVPIASMANVGGIATAPAVTAAYEKRWMPHAILLAILSMATGTFWGMFTIYLLSKFFT